jgi:glycosyltransferase involved in cell wall biosynthesis
LYRHNISEEQVRISFLSNHPATATGYGTQTAQLTRRLVADGHQVAIINNYGVAGQISEWEGIPVFPQGWDGYSNDVAVAHHTAWSMADSVPSILFTLYDVWVYQDNDQFDDVERIVSWVPIDHVPMPPKVLAWCERPNVTPVAMSKFGSQQLAAAGVEHFYVPHAIEPVFTRTDTLPDGKDFREAAGVPRSAHLTCIVAANKGVLPNRKSFGEMFSAWSVFAANHDDAVLYVHSSHGGGRDQIDLRVLAKACGIEDRVLFADQYALRLGIDPAVLAAIYSTSDVLLASSAGEGFGIPVIEAQACGLKVIVSDFSAQPELVGDGWIVGGQPQWNPTQHAWLFSPSVAEIAGALEASYKAPRGRSKKAEAHAAQYYADTVYNDLWRPVLADIEAAL